MFVTFLLRATCPVCGFTSRGWSFRDVRVNKRSIRTIDKVGLGAIDRSCRECGSPDIGEAVHAGIDPKSLVEINTWRARKGWDPVPDLPIRQQRKATP